jgi:FtsP/CotA-like multicopper oxidase with cupredoxin domain
MHLPARFDGGPYQMIPPGATWSPSWTIDQPAATLWYHPHPHGETREHVNRGLAGMFILNDVDDPATRAIPHEYGVDDIPVIVQDRSFGSSGDQKVANLGDTVLVNGTYSPFLEVTTQAVRLRPPAEFDGWKDTVFLPPGTTARLAMRFADYNDPHTPYKFHCHRLRHEDRGMMASSWSSNPVGSRLDSSGAPEATITDTAARQSTAWLYRKRQHTPGARVVCYGEE